LVRHAAVFLFFHDAKFAPVYCYDPEIMTLLSRQGSSFVSLYPRHLVCVEGDDCTDTLSPIGTCNINGAINCKLIGVLNIGHLDQRPLAVCWFRCGNRSPLLPSLFHAFLGVGAS
jgi:hypothetical protein